MQKRALTIIRDEHRALAAVLRGLQYLVESARKGPGEIDLPLVRSMLNYIEAFPDKLHHPKEDQYLYRILRDRDPSVVATLDLLEDEHKQEPHWLQNLRNTLKSFEEDNSAFDDFASAVETYVASHFSHMNKEEDIILPLAETALQDEDWQEIDAAFASNEDPLVGVGTQREFRDLFSRIVNLMPAPYGLGPEKK
ncbi:MAG: hemerythrin domain-containing protein [Gammaproteobacteria bacterium]|nr:hemerythrin domain-containing protein [Gammaproteobacteria bacterium]